jgi:hypothetical protein
VSQLSTGVYASEAANPVRIRITAEVDGVCRKYEMTYDRYGKDNVVVGYAYAKADAPGGNEADAGLAVVVKAFTDEKPKA